MHWTKEEIKQAPKVKRLNLINGLTGIKPANLIGTVSKSGVENVAVFSSVVHLGSNPALYGFILRPTGDVPRNTHENIRETGFYTINQIQTEFVNKAHYTSAKFDKDISEFEICGLTPEYKTGFSAPFVKESLIQLGMRFVEEIPIPINGTSLIIGEIEHIFMSDHCLSDEGHVDLEKVGGAGISGLNSYYGLTKIAQFPYARTHEIPEFEK